MTRTLKKEKKMTIQNADFSAWVNEIKPTEWGAYVKLSHERRVFNEATKTWETLGRDYIDASVPAELLPVFESNKLVKIICNVDGTPNAYLSNAGEPKATLKIRVTSVSPVERSPRDGEPVSTQINSGGLPPRAWVPNEANLAATLGATPLDEDAPF